MNDSDDILGNADNYNDDDLADLDPTMLKELQEENESLLLQFQATQDDIAYVSFVCPLFADQLINSLLLLIVGK